MRTLNGFDIKVENSLERELILEREMGGKLPSFSLTVAYREFAKGQDCRLQKPLTLYSLRQKF
jgi:hypothetical protein